MHRLRLSLVALVLLAACGAYDLFGEQSLRRGGDTEETADSGDAVRDAGDVGEDGGEPDAGQVIEDGGDPDAGHVVDAGEPDAGHGVDAGESLDAGEILDAGDPRDGGSPTTPCPDGMILIDGGTFSMGRLGGDSDEKPVHDVTLSAYCLDRTEVTVEAYARLRTPPTQAARYSSFTQPQQETWNSYCNGAHADRGTHPINCVNQVDAEFYCRDRGARLPTEAEWEFAARGATGRLYPWGGAPPDVGLANLCGTECNTTGGLPVISGSAYPSADPWPQTAPVASVDGDQSPFAIRDLGGNVMEWVADVYAFYPSSPQTNPRVDPGQGIGAGWVLRGASWMSSNPVRLTATSRWSSVSEGWPTFGFRCAANPRVL